MGPSGALSSQYVPPPAARTCRDARIEIMKTYTFIRSDEMAENTGTWIDPEVDTIFLWDRSEGKATSCKNATGDIDALEKIHDEAEFRMRHDPSFALGTRPRAENLSRACHIAIPESIFAGTYDDDDYFEYAERKYFQQFLGYKDCATLTFVWNCSEAKYLEDDGDMELVEESDDYSWNRHSIQISRGNVEMYLSSVTENVPNFKMARIQERSP
jgi:hypothetical protein